MKHKTAKKDTSKIYPAGPEELSTWKEKTVVFTKAFLFTLIVFLSAFFLWQTYDFFYEPEFESGITIEEIMPTPQAPSAEIVPTPAPTPEPQLSSNVKAYLSVDGVDIANEPVLQHPTQDEFYLNHDEYDRYSVWGSYYVYHDWHIESVNELDKVTVIFGHSNGNSLHRKFSVLKNLKDAAFAQKHQFIYLTIGNVKTCWQIFAAADYPVENNYVVANPDATTFTWQMEQIKSYSYNKYKTNVGESDKVLILSTCTGHKKYDTRFIVAAKLIGTE